MAQNTTVSVSADTWTQLTDADVTSITFQNQSDDYVFVQATADTNAPTTLTGAIRYRPNQGERNVSLSDLFPGVASAVRVWAYCKEAAEVTVSHA